MLAVAIKVGLPALMSGGTASVILGALSIVGLLLVVVAFITYMVTAAHPYPKTTNSNITNETDK